MSGALVAEAADGCRLGGVDIENGEQLGHLQNFLEFLIRDWKA